MWYVKFITNDFFNILFIQTKKSKQIKQTKLLLKFTKAFKWKQQSMSISCSIC